MMKTTTLFLSMAFLALALGACSDNDKKDDPKLPAGEEKEIYVNDSNAKASKWTYISLATGTIVGSDLRSDDDGKVAAWGARKDWDIAINRYKVRTNSGEVTSVESKGGVCILEATEKFDNVKKVPANAKFGADKTVETPGMGGSIIEKRSDAFVVLVSAGDKGMKYDPSPLYIFRSADGKKYYKLLFTQYFDAESNSGHVKFKYVEIYM